MMKLFFNLFLYNSEDIIITDIADIKLSCIMIGNEVNISLETNIKSVYVQFTFKKEDEKIFKNWYQGICTLIISANSQIKSYDLNLIHLGINNDNIYGSIIDEEENNVCSRISFFNKWIFDK